MTFVTYTCLYRCNAKFDDQPCIKIEKNKTAARVRHVALKLKTIPANKSNTNGIANKWTNKQIWRWRERESMIFFYAGNKTNETISNLFTFNLLANIHTANPLKMNNSIANVWNWLDCDIDSNDWNPNKRRNEREK